MPKSVALLAPDPRAVWPTKAAAAASLGCSARTLERYITSGKLMSRLQNAAGRKPLVLVDPDGLARLLASGKVAASPAPAAVSALPEPLALLALLAAALPGPRAEPRPWLTLDEAAEFSGLPRGWLLSQARAGKLAVLNLGTPSRSVWRFHRDTLAVWPADAGRRAG